MSNKNQKTTDTIRSLVADATRIIVVAHKDPDGDAIGASLAMALALEKMGKEVILYNVGPKPVIFQFLPQFESFSFGTAPQVGNDDLVIALDYGAWKRTGLDDSVKDGQIITIDHHPEREEHRGDVRLFDTEASSVCEMLFYLFKEWDGVEIDRDMATCLMTGIVTDTGGFQHSNTGKGTLKAAEELMLQGAPLHHLMKLFTSISKNALGIWEWAIGAVELHEKNFAYCMIPADVLEQFEVDSDALGGLANVMATIPEAQFALMLREESDSIKGSLRSTTEKDYDCAGLAATFGGGGHRLAAGFTEEGTLEQVLEKVADVA